MIRIQLNNEWMDTYIGEEIQLSWGGFRFQKSLRAGYTNDLHIPKTENNLRLLGAVGLLDSQTQMFGAKTVSCILQNGLIMTPMMLQVAGISESDIKICLYENTFPEYFKEKTLRDYFVDNPNTIYAWNINTMPVYAGDFYQYNYGMPYDANYAQYHPVKNMNLILSDISAQSGYNIPSVNNDWYLMATKKVVCPQNQRQVIEGYKDFSESSTSIHLSGGQHITNNMEISYSGGQTEIIFNRYATVNMTVYVSWRSKATSYATNLVLTHNINGNNTNQNFQIRGDLYRNKIDTFNASVSVQEGSRLKFSFINGSNYEMCRILIDFSISGYVINDDDYSEELQYIGRAPRLPYYDYNSNSIQIAYFDGSSYHYSYKNKNQSGSSHAMFNTTWRSLSYFGYWANVKNEKITNMLYSLQWFMGKKLMFDNQNTLSWESPNGSETIDGNITEMRPISARVGQKNYIQMEADDDPRLICEIPNEWLAYKYNIHESCFARVYNLGSFYGKLNQYSDPEHDDGSEQYSCSFNDIDALALWWRNTQQGGMTVEHQYIRDVPMNTLGFEGLNQSVEVDITTYTPLLRDKDIVYLDGRRFLVITGKNSLDNQKTNLTCLLYPNIMQKDKIQQSNHQDR